MIVRDFMIWWAGELGALSPDWLSQGLGQASRTLFVDPAPSIWENGEAAALPEDWPVELVLLDAGRETPLGSAPLGQIGSLLEDRPESKAGRIPIVIRLPPSLILQRMLNLPLAAEPDLFSIAALEMDRETPFSTEEVHWNIDVTARHRGANTLDACISLVLRSDIQPFLHHLRLAALDPGAVTVTGSSEPLIHLEGQPKKGTHRFSAFTQWALAALILLAIAFPILRQSLALHQIQAKIDALAPALAEVNRLRAKSGGTQAITAARASQPNVLDLLSSITSALPDDTSLTDLTYQNHKLVMDGRSQDSAKLIGTLSKNQFLASPTFSAPISRTEDDKADLFQITAQVVPAHTPQVP